jgi:hypothetical protein
LSIFKVRLAASIATRNFFLNNSLNEVYLKHLLPCMCLNRYYLAEGVKLYSQDTWLLIFKTNGRSFVEKYLSFVIDYYLKQVYVHNTVTKEATCACISELFGKINHDLLKPYLNDLSKSLIDCFNCESWTVRDGKSLKKCILNLKSHIFF